MDNRHETQRSPLGSRAGPGRRPRSGRFRPTRLRRSPGHGLVTDWSRTGHGRRAPSAARMRPGRQRAAQPARSPGYRPGASRPGTDSGPAGPARLSVSRCRPGRAVGGACRAERRPWAGRSRGAQHTHTHPATSSFRRRPPASGPACANTPPGACKACTGARKACTKRRPCMHTACKACMQGLHAGPTSCLHRCTQGLHKKAALHPHGMQGLACRAAFLPAQAHARLAQKGGLAHGMQGMHTACKALHARPPSCRVRGEHGAHNSGPACANMQGRLRAG